jgi:hypothetical protein
MQVDRAVVAAGCGLAEEALIAALEAIRGLAVSEILYGRGEDVLRSTINPLDIWQTLSEKQRRLAQNELFWLVIGPLVLGALAAGRNVDVIDIWLRQITRQKETLLNFRYWEEVLGAGRLIFSPIRREGIIERLNALGKEDVAVRLLLYLALSQSAGSVLSEALIAHSIVLGSLLDRERTASTMLDDFATYLLRYWRRVADERGFQLRSPGEFRSRIGAVLGKGDTGSACRVLLLAEEALGGSLPAEIRRKISARISA